MPNAAGFNATLSSMTVVFVVNSLMILYDVFSCQVLMVISSWKQRKKNKPSNLHYICRSEQKTNLIRENLLWSRMMNEVLSVPLGQCKMKKNRFLKCDSSCRCLLLQSSPCSALFITLKCCFHHVLPLSNTDVFYYVSSVIKYLWVEREYESPDFDGWRWRRFFACDTFRI